MARTQAGKILDALYVRSAIEPSRGVVVSVTELDLVHVWYRGDHSLTLADLMRAIMSLLQHSWDQR